MTWTIAQFRATFPEFNNLVTYPDQLVENWSAVAQMQLPQATWRGMWVMGVNLYTAHEITLAAQNAKAASAGGVPGVSSGGVANSKTVGSVTVGYDTQSIAEKDAGYWNLTNYGKRFIRYCRIYGAGVVQL